MDLIEYEAEINKIKNEMHLKKMRINKEYALSNNTVVIGEIVADHIGSIRVESISVFHNTVPSCIYTGACYTKSGKPFKSGEKRSLYQINI